jgi:hypothetical protein
MTSDILFENNFAGEVFMNKRRSKRISDNLDAEIISGGVSYPGIVMNFSDEGLYMVTATANNDVDITPSSTVELKCKLPGGQSLNMNCEVKWFQTKTSPHGVSFSMGMQIKSPPKAYEDFLNNIK